MDEENLKKRLTVIYDCRLKSLIGYRSTRFTEDIVNYMFAHFDKLAENGNEAYKDVLKSHVWDVVTYMPGQGRNESGSACYSSVQLMMRLENYIRSNVELLFPDWKSSFNENEYRKVLGQSFRDAVQRQPSRFPSILGPNHFLSQLNYTTMYRNKFAHHESGGGSVFYPRYIIFLAYEVLLSYLLYTFYYMALVTVGSGEKDPLEHIND